MNIEPYQTKFLGAILDLGLRAWTPVFASIERELAPELYQTFYPDGWRVSQAQAITSVCAAAVSGEMAVWVSLPHGVPVGFVAAKLDPPTQMGEVYMVAVDPDCQGRGMGSALITHALGWLSSQGMGVAMVETGGDPGHEPARRTYEKLGFGLWPTARYFKRL
ncbi:MAG: GNAT family N-acetyltransferase [Oscillatoriales cyanobacterium SM2_2_1]|nr:GNAT family N-acetyltransferase [Oscillatoriales cyanobacterium SM2_2_1]